MRIAIIETVPKPKNPIDAHVRNSIIIQKCLAEEGHEINIFFCDDVLTGKFDVILISYATPYPSFKRLDEFFQDNKYAPVGWITNEYNLRPNGMFYKIFKSRKSFVLANYVSSAVKFSCFDNFYHIDINPLLFVRPKRKPEKKYDFIYFGTFREGRTKYFRRYLHAPVYLSTSTKNAKKFIHEGCNPVFIKKLNWKNSALSKFRFSLYIEDEFTHSNYNTLSNRFYESLANECVVLFDESCRNTLEKSGLEKSVYENFIISSLDDMKAKFNERNYQINLERQMAWMDAVEIKQKKVIKDIENILKAEISANQKEFVSKRGDND